ncbi:hypothetical protein, partial [Cryobacterium sp. TMB3-15]|uniref:hypothetical protein n=1 Tax=Cryobacterium sp. TMB3-15 TaxID=1259211 RepID=UPI001A7E09CB
MFSAASMPISPAVIAAATNGNSGSRTVPPSIRGETFSPRATRRFISGTDVPVSPISRSFWCDAPNRQANDSAPSPLRD